MDRQRIAVVDDNEINRLLISNMLDDKYELLEATNGVEALALIQSCHGDIDLMLLDLIMPEMDGIELLKEMNNQGWINTIPVIVISSEMSANITRKAYELGAEDFIGRPFDPDTVSKRIQKAIILHAERKNLVGVVTDEFRKRERQTSIMINVLSHIVEQRNGESGLHVIHINIITALILKCLTKKTNKYNIKEEDISIICNASSLHDVGKMGIPEAILNKPGKLTTAEYEVIKTHSMLGYEMMDMVAGFRGEALLEYAKNICRYHHERWDGNGYPDGLKGEEIPIEAQIVALADVYDALISERCYKDAYTHEQAIEMILNGECGEFNPILIECLREVEAELKPLSIDTSGEFLIMMTENILSEQTLNLINSTKSIEVSRNIRLLRTEEERSATFNMLTDEAWFEYYTRPEMIKLNPHAAEMFNLPLQIINPSDNQQFLDVFGDVFKNIGKDNVETQEDVELLDVRIVLADGKKYRIKGKKLFSNMQGGYVHLGLSGIVGKIARLDD